MELYDNYCVWVSHWEMIRYPGLLKARRVRRAFPMVYAGTVYTFCQLGDELTAFKGWTRKALASGRLPGTTAGLSRYSPLRRR